LFFGESGDFGIFCLAGVDPSCIIDEAGRWEEKYAREREVNIKIMAAAAVNFSRKLPGPLLPKIVELEPPKAAPISAPFPVCKSTIIISAMHTIICIVIIKVSIKNQPPLFL